MFIVGSIFLFPVSSITDSRALNFKEGAMNSLKSEISHFKDLFTPSLNSILVSPLKNEVF